MRPTAFFSLALVLLTTSGIAAGSDQDDANVVFQPALFKSLQYRLAGPFRGGRSTAVSGVLGKPYLFYMGSTGGGLWQSDDAGQSWTNITDGQIGVGSIGAIAVAPSDPNVLYLGTGSSSPRGNISIGDGVYKSTDAGKTWVHSGLPKAGLISRIRVHPRDPDLVYAAVMGNIFAPNPERGVYRSRDGGASWERIHFVSDRTGCVDLAMDLTNPRILYAGMWTVERKPWTLVDGSDEGGVWKTSDGGQTWKKLEKGLPTGVIGRIGLDVSPADPSRVWVITAAPEKRGGLFRSDDGGKRFRRVSRKRDLLQRAWYYSRVFADPVDADTIYVTNVGFWKSVDGGASFSRISTPHGDNHDLWINPDDPRIMIESNDGGANVSLNGGRTWTTQTNQPTAEFYRVTVDNQFPYRLYGAQQDNSTISVPSRSPGGINPKQHWFSAGGGESGHIAVDPRDPNVIYAGNYIGQITRLDRSSGHQRSVTHYPQLHDGLAGKQIRHRFQWNAPIRLSPHDPDTLYHTSQYVHVSRDGGQSWTIISPDLTTNNTDYQELPGGPVQHDHTGVELYCTIFSFEESPHQPGLLWAGTDDGRVHISRDAGGEWREITPSEMPSEGTVNTIELSEHSPGRAFLAVYRYRRGDSRPYVFRTDDFGANWALLTDGTNGIPADHFVRVVREDPDRKGLLYAGTEFGIYASFDDGLHWQSLQQNLPRTPITDLQVHRKDLVVATQGRSFWILDDLTPLHQLDESIAQANQHLFQPRNAYRTQLRGFRGPGAPSNPPNGAVIRYFLSQQAAEGREDGPEIKLEILDSQGSLIRTFTAKPGEDSRPSQPSGHRPQDPEPLLPTEAGLNTFAWDLRFRPPHLVENARMSISFTGGPTAPPGEYQVRMSVAGQEQTRSFQLRKDPRWKSSDEDLKRQFDFVLQTRDLLTRSHDAIRTIRSVKDQVGRIAQRAEKAGRSELIGEAADSLKQQLGKIEEELIQTRNESGQDPLNFPPKLDNQIAYLYGFLNSQDALPTRSSHQRYQDLEAELATHLESLRRLLDSDLKAYNELLVKEGATGVILPEGL